MSEVGADQTLVDAAQVRRVHRRHEVHGILRQRRPGIDRHIEPGLAPTLATLVRDPRQLPEDPEPRVELIPDIRTEI